MKKKIKYIIIILIITLNNVTFGFTGNSDNISTIKELSNQVKKIDNTKEKQAEILQNLKKELLIQKFFKKNLFDKQRKELDKLVLEYKKNKDELENNLKSAKSQKRNTIIKKLLENEKEIYKKLLPYIQIEKYEEYKDFIKKDLEIVNSNLNLDIEKTDKEKILKEKLYLIKKKIKKHKKFINKRIKEIIEKKIEEKLNNLIQKEKFLKLKNDDKKLVFEKLQKKLKNKLNQLKDEQGDNEQKIEIYELIIEKIIIFKNKYKEE